MRHATFATLTIVLLLGTHAARAADLSTGRTKAFAHGGPVLTSAVPIVSATISRGKARSVLTIDATVVPSGVEEMAVVILVNGILRPGFLMGQRCDLAVNCSAGGSFWVDLDEAEAAVPGTVYNQPVVVDVIAWDYENPVSSPGTAGASLTLHMEHK
jgi:hypothetical protein